MIKIKKKGRKRTEIEKKFERNSNRYIKKKILSYDRTFFYIFEVFYFLRSKI